MKSAPYTPVKFVSKMLNWVPWLPPKAYGIGKLIKIRPMTLDVVIVATAQMKNAERSFFLYHPINFIPKIKINVMIKKVPIPNPLLKNFSEKAAPKEPPLFAMLLFCAFSRIVFVVTRLWSIGPLFMYETHAMNSKKENRAKHS